MCGKKKNIIIFIIFIILKMIENFYKKIERFGKKNTEKYTAVIVEPRKHKALKYVLNNFMENLDERWNFIIFHGNKNEEFVNDIINSDLTKYKNKIHLINLNIDNLNIDEYSKLLKSKSFYENIPTEIFMIFQTDSGICGNQRHLINDFIDYDYVGAPWGFNGRVGNGGLSIRKKSKMLEIIEKCPINDEHEDVFFSYERNNIKINKPDFEKAKQFSVETVFSEKSFGFHSPWKHLNTYEYDLLKKNCPEVDIVKNLQGSY